MAIEFDRKVITFPPATVPQTINDFITFSAPVLQAAVAMEGWELEFNTVGPTAHRVDVMQADTQFVSIVGNDVNFQVSINLADASANDSYQGSVNVFVIAKV